MQLITLLVKRSEFELYVLYRIQAMYMMARQEKPSHNNIIDLAWYGITNE
jgi:hypothetical protein